MCYLLQGNIGWTLVENPQKVAEIIFDLDPDHTDSVPIEFGIQIIEGLGYFLIAINSKYVLSAAHCHSKGNKKNQIATVALGENEIGVNPDCPSGHGLKASRETLAGLQ